MSPIEIAYARRNFIIMFARTLTNGKSVGYQIGLMCPEATADLAVELAVRLETIVHVYGNREGYCYGVNHLGQRIDI